MVAPNLLFLKDSALGTFGKPETIADFNATHSIQIPSSFLMTKNLGS